MSMSSESSSSGAITSSFENISDVFTSYSEIPSSGFNCLYKAQRYGKWFVLKGLKPEYRNQALYLELLAKEFELGMKMEHPHIAHTFSKETDPVAGPCMVMEYVDGVTLREFLETKPDAKTRLKIVRELLSAMAYYHNLQIIHRDLKPDNILITRNGHNVKLIDFGLADSDYHGILKQPAGTNRYAAPEQAAGDRPIDLRADLYAFGIILPQIFPHRYKTIARKCTRADREKRFGNAEEILRQLQRRRILVPCMIAAVALAVVVASLLLFLPYLQKDNVVEPQSAGISAVVPATDSIKVIHDTITVVESGIPKEVQLFMDKKMDSIMAPFRSWFKTTLAENVACDSAQALAVLTEYNHKMLDYLGYSARHTHSENIVDQTLKRYPNCSDVRFMMIQYMDVKFTHCYNEYNNTIVGFYEEKAKKQ